MNFNSEIIYTLKDGTILRTLSNEQNIPDGINETLETIDIYYNKDRVDPKTLISKVEICYTKER